MELLNPLQLTIFAVCLGLLSYKSIMTAGNNLDTIKVKEAVFLRTDATTLTPGYFVFALMGGVAKLREGGG